MNAIKVALLGLIGIVGIFVSVFGIRIPFTESFVKEHWKAGVTAILLILLVIPAIFGLFVYLFDANKFKSEIVHYVKEHTQRDLILRGDIKVTFFPKLGMDTGNVSLSQRNSAKEFASINNARLYVAWLPLFRKQLVFDHVEMDGVRANLVRYKDGTTNFDDLLIKDEKLAPMTFDIDSVHISNSSLKWQDEIRWKRIAFNSLQLETGRLADSMPSHLKASFGLDSEKLHSDTHIELKSRLFYDGKTRRYEFADIEGKLQGTLSGFSNLDLNFRGSADTHDLENGQGSRSMLMENVVVSGKGNYGQRNLAGSVNVAKIQFAGDVLSGSQSSFEGTVSQFDEKWTISMRMPAFEYSKSIFRSESYEAEFGFNNDVRSLQGKSSGRIRADLTEPSKLQVDPLVLELNAKHPMLSGEITAKTTGSLNAGLSEQTIRLDLKGMIEDGDATGTFAIKDFSRPEYQFDIDVTRLDLDRYISGDWIRHYRDGGARLDFNGLKNLHLNGHLHAGEVKAAGLNAANLKADIHVEQSRLLVQPIKAKLYGGVLTGSLEVAAQELSQIAFKQKLEGVQASALLADTSSAGKLSGKGNFSLEVSAEGNDFSSLRRSLNGNVSVSLAKGSLAGINLRSALIDGKDEIGVQNGHDGKPLVVRYRDPKFKETTGFSELKAAFDFKNGKSHGNSFEMKSPLFRVGGEGSLMVESGNIDYQLSATVSSALRRRNVGELSELKGVTIPIRVNGTLSDPRIALVFSEASGELIDRRIEAAKKDIEKNSRKSERSEIHPVSDLVTKDQTTKEKPKRKKAATKKQSEKVAK